MSMNLGDAALARSLSLSYSSLPLAFSRVGTSQKVRNVATLLKCCSAFGSTATRRAMVQSDRYPVAGTSTGSSPDACGGPGSLVDSTRIALET